MARGVALVACRARSKSWASAHSGCGWTWPAGTAPTPSSRCGETPPSPTGPGRRPAR